MQSDLTDHRLGQAAPRPDRAPLPPLTANASLRWDVVRRLLPARPGAVLEIGCGRGAATARIARRADRMVAVEPDAQSCAVARASLGDRVELHNCMSFELPGTDRFDTICAFEVLEHIEDDIAALEEWKARLKPGGHLLLSVPAWQARMAAADELTGHFRRYDPDHMATVLAQAGFTEVSVELYGFGSGHLLEAIRNMVARHRLAAGASDLDIASRTAGSGRLLQPSQGLLGTLTGLAARPLVWLQRAFPNRGVGLVARARKPL